MSWVAWHGDILPGNDRLLMKVPVATDSGKSITGRIRTEHILEQDGVTSVSLGNGPYTGNSHDGYEACEHGSGHGHAHDARVSVARARSRSLRLLDVRSLP